MRFVFSIIPRNLCFEFLFLRMNKSQDSQINSYFVFSTIKNITFWRFAYWKLAFKSPFFSKILISNSFEGITKESFIATKLTNSPLFTLFSSATFIEKHKKIAPDSLLIFPFYNFSPGKNVFQIRLSFPTRRRSGEHKKRSDAVQQLDGNGLSITSAIGVIGADIAALESNRSLVLDAESIFLQWKCFERSSSASPDVWIKNVSVL